MSNSNFQSRRGRLSLAVSALALLAALAAVGGAAQAATWNGIEPFKSRRADVERTLGKPVGEATDGSGSLRFSVQGGTVQVQFVDAKFVASKKLSPDAVGTVLQIVLQHDRAPDTPESLKLADNKDFEREARGNITVFRNNKEGVFYTFIDGRLKTTRYAASADQIARAQRR